MTKVQLAKDVRIEIEDFGEMRVYTQESTAYTDPDILKKINFIRSSLPERGWLVFLIDPISPHYGQGHVKHVADTKAKEIRVYNE